MASSELPQDIEDLRERLTRGSWTPSSVREPLYVHKGQPVSGMYGAARRGDCFGTLAIALDADESDRALLDGLYARPCGVAHRVGRSRLYVSALDGQRARQELERLLPALRTGQLEAVAAAVTARGWIVDRDRSYDLTYDGSIQVTAVRDGEELSTGASWFGAAALQDLAIDERGRASARPSRSLSVDASVASAACARALLQALVPTLAAR